MRGLLRIFGVIAMMQFALPSGLFAQNSPGPGEASIRGTVFDSLVMATVPFARVTLLPGNRSATANQRGEFAFDRVTTGEYTVTYASPLLDSIGLGTVGTTVSVSDSRTRVATVTTPSLRTLWLTRCQAGNVVARSAVDSGIVWGTIGDAASDTLLDGATANFQWYDLTPRQMRTLDVPTVRQTVRTNASGMYFACGIPESQKVQTVATTPDAASAVIDYTLGVQRVRRLDLLVSPDMLVANEVPVDSAAVSAFRFARGTAILRGVVTDTANKPLAGVVVGVASSEYTARTDEQGRFRLDGLPAGTQILEVKRIGSYPVLPVVQLRSNQTVDVAVQMNTATTLSTFAVRGMSARRAEFEERKLSGISFVIDSARLERPDLASAMLNVPYVFVSRDGWGIKIHSRDCCALFLDGLPVERELVGRLSPDYFRAIEVIRIGAQVPAKYYSGGAGVILFWSKNVIW